MANPYLHGNAMPCPACEGRGGLEVVLPAGDMSIVFGKFWPETDIRAYCKACEGSGRVARPDARIVCDMVQAARAARFK